MTFNELVEAVRKLPCQEMRAQTENSSEVVVKKAHLSDLNAALETYFGPPLKAENQLPTREAELYTKAYGGIRREQTLYHSKTENAMALLWPWNGGNSVTVKIVRL